jgi:hypothetical protein
VTPRVLGDPLQRPDLGALRRDDPPSEAADLGVLAVGLGHLGHLGGHLMVRDHLAHEGAVGGVRRTVCERRGRPSEGQHEHRGQGRAARETVDLHRRFLSFRSVVDRRG